MKEKPITNWKDSVEENIRSGLIEILILSMLAKEDRYAYDIKLELDEQSGGLFKMRDGSMYGPMYRMLERKLISSYQVPAGEKRIRNYYHIEESGREYLEYSVKMFYEIYGTTDTIIRNINKSIENGGEKEEKQ